jgi:ArsR family transcriptional regulator
MAEDPFKMESEILAAIAHPNRMRIIDRLRKKFKCNCELIEELDLEQSNLSRHLKLLVDAGVLISWKDGVRVNYRVADKRIFELIDIAAAVSRGNIERRFKALKAG